MTTPSFNPQDATSLTEVRLFTPIDPYHYTVDNRPLQDLISNLNVVAGGGVDSARRSALLTQLALSDVFRNLFRHTNKSHVVTGLDVEYFGTDYVRVGAGAVYTSMDVNASLTDRVIKQALKTSPQNFTFTRPPSPGSSVVYVLAGRYADLNAENMGNSGLPYLDPQNSFLPAVLLNGELRLQIIPGAVAPTGTEAAPSVPSGWFPIYELNISNGSSQPRISLSPNGPAVKGLRESLTLAAAAATPATTVNINGITTFRFPKGSSTILNANLSLRGLDINPYAPIRFRVLHSGSNVNGNYAFRLRVGTYAPGSPITAAQGLIAQPEAIPGEQGSAGDLQAFDSPTFSIPPNMFAGFVDNRWVVNRDFMNLSFQRDIASALDTSSGEVRFHEVVAYQ